MSRLYARMRSSSSLNRSGPTSSGAKDSDSTASTWSWIEMIQRNPQVNTLVQALPDQRTFKDFVDEIDMDSLKYWSLVVSFFLISLTITITPPIIFGLSTSGEDLYNLFDCQPDGRVAISWADDSPTYSPWRISSLLDISIAGGAISFPVAKLIDVLWDTIFGRGGQAVLTMLVYRVLSQALLYSMETRRSSFRKFAAISFEGGSLTALRVFVQDLYLDRKARTPRATLLVIAFILSTTYVVAFPTIVSGITGYQANSVAYGQNPADGSLVPFAQLKAAALIIYDGSRVGLTDDYLCLTDNPYGTLSADSGSETDACIAYYSHVCSYHACPSNRTSEFTSSLNQTISLDSPTLNIEFIRPDMDLTKAVYMLDNQTISAEWLKDHMHCQPTSHYKWGFSALGLFIWLVFTSVFSTTLYAVWLPTFLFSRVDQSGRRLGTYRAAVDMASAFREEFGQDCDTMSDKQIRKELETRDAGIRIDADVLPAPRSSNMKILKLKAFWKVGRYQALRRERAASRAFEET